MGNPCFDEVTVWALLPASLSSPPTVTLAGETARDAIAPLTSYFIKFDIHSGNLALLIWSFYLYLNASPAASAVGALFKIVCWTLVGGPAAAATALLWGRDEALLGGGKSAGLKPAARA